MPPDTPRKPRSRPSGAKAGKRSPSETLPAEGLTMGLVETAVHSDLSALPSDLANSALAAASVALARKVDDPRTSATACSMCSKALLDIMDRLRELTPPDEKADDIDELKAKRAVRLAEK